MPYELILVRIRRELLKQGPQRVGDLAVLAGLDSVTTATALGELHERGAICPSGDLWSAAQGDLFQ